jgi:hypothetical protein
MASSANLPPPAFLARMRRARSALLAAALTGLLACGGSSPDASQGPTPPPEEPPPPEPPPGPPNPSVCGSTPTHICPGDDWAAKVAAASSGTTFTIGAGVHRLPSVTPKSGDVFVAEPGAVMNGARELTGWVAAGATWHVDGQTQGGTPAAGNPAQVCDEAHPRCLYSEDLFLDGIMLRHAASVAEVGAGSWFFDYAADRIYLGSDPTGHTVETSVAPFAFSGDAPGVIIRGLVIEKYAARYNTGAITAGAAWSIEDVTARLNHGAGVALFGGGTVLRGVYARNGQYGLIANRGAPVLRDAEVSENNLAGFSISWAAGGGKWSNTSGLRIVGSRFLRNHGHAIWVDIDNYGAVIDSNMVEDNDGRGVFYEISYDAVIRDNSFARNGYRTGALLRGGCIGIVASPNVEVFGNHCDGDRDGITGIQDARGSGGRGPHQLRNLVVHDNRIDNIPGHAAGILQTVGDPTYYNGHNNVWRGNQYSGLVPAKPFFWLNASRSAEEWASYGQQ